MRLMAISKATETSGKPGVNVLNVERKGQITEGMSREAFRERFKARFYDPAFRAEEAAIERLEAIAWQAYAEGRKAPVTKNAGASSRATISLLNGEARVNVSTRRGSVNRTGRRALVC
ncbi:hypothetical protein AB4Y32_36505 [Paraburkholderia phymatum]|uniref:Uncharacterized protein n=1 Tax=Paraburkholderia phymatum TaxID=148447 RepID=A0ACC6UC13_9BURK